MLMLVRLAQVLGDEVLMRVVAMRLGCVFVLVRVLVTEVFKPADPLDEVVRQVVIRMPMPDGVVLVFWPTRVPGTHRSSRLIIMPQDGRLERTRCEPSRDSAVASIDHRAPA